MGTDASWLRARESSASRSTGTWWRDRAGAASRLIARIDALAAAGIPADVLDLDEHTWFPEWVAVIEGHAREAGTDAVAVEVVGAEASGDDTIVTEAARLASAGRLVTVVTSDRELAGRVTDAGATVRGARWLLDLLA